MNNWTYNPKGTFPTGAGKAIIKLTDIPDHESIVGFCYKITGPDGRIYIGRKALQHTTRVRISATEKKKTKTKNRYKEVTKDSGWRDYWGSCKELKADIQRLGEDQFTREILEFTCSPKKLGYLELKYQILYKVLEIDSYNGNILGRFFQKDINQCL